MNTPTSSPVARGNDASRVQFASLLLLLLRLWSLNQCNACLLRVRHWGFGVGGGGGLGCAMEISEGQAQTKSAQTTNGNNENEMSKL